MVRCFARRGKDVDCSAEGNRGMDSTGIDFKKRDSGLVILWIQSCHFHDLCSASFVPIHGFQTDVESEGTDIGESQCRYTKP